eukprot:CAMPEP_0197920602 /NCGR_PEP_ID=MMETSP1439-20131203/89247_1 /TAXON_ID=66791 /ORGANISM="Gonyaulax spinifera, Strain CCMP409" /LENGTH=60 /DNA_ID=CAMNT_0043542809 /DNA_START=212 /DNA_END=394 /DNA_ORIENTATION=+
MATASLATSSKVRLLMRLVSRRTGLGVLGISSGGAISQPMYLGGATKNSISAAVRSPWYV